MASSWAAQVDELRNRLDHPVIDGDGHVLEVMPIFLRYVDRVGGEGTGDRLMRVMADAAPPRAGDADRGFAQSSWWGVSNDADDLATAAVPDLLATRLDELGFDYVVLYPSAGLSHVTLPHDELRRIACRALNVMNAELTAAHGDRMTVAAAVPMHTPEEAVDELTYAVRELGAKVAMIPPGVGRPWPAHADTFPVAQFVDRFGIDSRFDYDPVWQAFVDLGVAVTAHGSASLPNLDCARRSVSSYVFNHVRAHAFLQEELAKSLFLGGVPKRFPELRIAFLECGAGWAADLLHSLFEHYEKRGPEGLRHCDPAGVDRDRLGELLGPYGIDVDSFAATWLYGSELARDEFAAAVDDEGDFRTVFGEQFFFGCESDDRSVYRALDGRGNPFGLPLQAFFSSDIGHFDVPRMGKVLLDSRHQVEAGLLSEDDYRAFTFTNIVQLHGGANPRFFEGTRVEAAAQQVLAGSIPAPRVSSGPLT